MSSGKSDVAIECTNNTHETKEADIEQQLCAEDLAVGRGSEEQDAQLLLKPLK